MSKLIKFAVLIIFVGTTKAHKLLFLAAIGLAALFMVHYLAQDWQIVNRRPAMKPKGLFLFKRSIEESPDWDKIIQKDILGCMRSFICQVVSKPQHELEEAEKAILKYVKHSLKDGDGNKILKRVVQQAGKLSGPEECLAAYRLCPYSNRVMISLLKLFN